MPKVWHVNLNEKKPSLFASVFTKLVVLADSLEECKTKVENYIKENEIDPQKELFIGKIEFVEEVDLD